MKRKSLILGICLGIGVLILIFLLLSSSWGGRIVSSTRPVDSIVLTDGHSQFSLDGSGNAVWTIDGVTRNELWTTDKTDSFFAYFYANWEAIASFNGSVATVSNSSDELAQIILGGGNTDEGGGGVSQYLTTPTPQPSGNGSGGDGGGTPGGSDGPPSWCQHWKLSYCADPPPSSAVPTQTPIPSGPTPLPPDCSAAGNQETGRTVIGNELCLSSSPTPTP